MVVPAIEVAGSGEPLEHSLDALVTRAREGDREAFGELYRARVASVGRYVGAILRDVDRTEDAVAQTFFLAWRDLRKLRKVERFDAWLFRIAHNHAINLVRRNIPTQSLEDAPEPLDAAGFASPEEALERRIDSERVRAALLDLPAARREVLVLRFFHERSHAEVARQLGKSEQAVRAMQYRALGQLRRRMPAPA